MTRPAPRDGGSPTLGRRAASEALGTGLLVAAVVGSGIMGERLADVPWFIGAQCVGGALAIAIVRWLLPPSARSDPGPG